MEKLFIKRQVFEAVLIAIHLLATCYTKNKVLTSPIKELRYNVKAEKNYLSATALSLFDMRSL